MSASDFYRYFYPAARAWLSGGSPYALEGVYNPLWAWWVLGPLAAWPLDAAWWGWMLLAVALLLLSLLLLRRPHPLALLALLLSPAALVHLAMGQWAVWALLGVLLLQRRQPMVQGAGLFLLSLKPHLGWPFLLLTAPRAWPLPLAALLLSLLVQPRWVPEFLAGLQAEPPVGYQNLLLARSLTLGTPFLVALALAAVGMVLWAIVHFRPDRRWQLALLCCVVLFLTPYHRVYDNVLLFHPILLLTEKHPWAWLPIVGLLWLPLLLIVYPWAVFVDWLPPFVVLLMLLRAIAVSERRLPPSLQPLPERSGMSPLPVSRREWQLAALLTLLVLLLALLPTWYGFHAAPEGKVFSGLLVNPVDGHSYLAKMRQGWRGQWLFTLPYTSETHAGAFIYPLYLALGHVARWASLPLVGLYHAARLLFGGMLLGMIFCLLARVAEDRVVRWAGWALAVLASGWGLFAAALGIVTIDLWVPEAFTFYSLLTNPHFPLSTALEIALLLLVFRDAPWRNDWQTLALLAASVALPLSAPFLVPLLWGALLCGVAGQRWRGGGWHRGQVARIILSMAATSTVMAYYFYLLLANPIIAGWGSQDDAGASSAQATVLGLGLLLPLALAGMWRWRRRVEPLVWALAGWLLLALLVQLVPFSLSRRLLGGVQVPLGVFGGAAVAWLLARLPRARYPLALTALALLTLSTPLFLYRSLFAATERGAEFAFYSADEAAALDWLAAHSTRQDVVLASIPFSNWVPVYSDARVVHGHTSEVIDGPAKEKAIAGFYGNTLGAEARSAFLSREGVSLIVYGPREQALAGQRAPPLASFPPIFSTTQVVIYHLPSDNE